MRPATFLILLSLAFLSGCAGSQNGPAASAAGPQPHAECLVCKANADLACVDVAVDDKTPSYAYNGKTYYFCSDECKDQCAKNPKNYVAK